MNAPAYQEPVFFQDAVSYVSRSRIVLNGTTYPVNGISAVRIFTIRKSPGALIVGIICAIIAFISLANEAWGPAVLFLLLGGGLIAYYIWLQKVRYGIALSTAGMNHNALFSENLAYVQAVNQAINHALASRY